MTTEFHRKPCPLHRSRNNSNNGSNNGIRQRHPLVLPTLPYSHANMCTPQRGWIVLCVIGQRTHGTVTSLSLNKQQISSVVSGLRHWLWRTHGSRNRSTLNNCRWNNSKSSHCGRVAALQANGNKTLARTLCGETAANRVCVFAHAYLCGMAPTSLPKPMRQVFRHYTTFSLARVCSNASSVAGI